MDKYNPFATDLDSPYEPFSQHAQSPVEAEVSPPIQEQIPSHNELAQREAALAVREAEIAAMERSQNRFEQGLPPKNFPPYINLWRFYPENEISDVSRPLLYQTRNTFLLCGITYALNFICSFMCMSSSNCFNSVGTIIVLSVIYLFVFYPIAPNVSLYLLYHALKEDKALKFIGFFICYGIWCVLLLFHSVGFNDAGALGLILMIDIFQNGKKWLGFFAIITSLCFLASLLYSVYTFYLIFKEFKGNDLTNQAVHEATEIVNDNRQALISVAADNPDTVLAAASHIVSQI